MSGAAYDGIGRSYAATRVPDPRIAARLHAALGDVASVVNVGAGTGLRAAADGPRRGAERGDARAARAGSGPRSAGERRGPPARRRVRGRRPRRAHDPPLARPRGRNRGAAPRRAPARRGAHVGSGRDERLLAHAGLLPRGDRVRPGARRADRAARGAPRRAARRPRRDRAGSARLLRRLLRRYWRRPGTYLDPGARAGMSALAQAGEIALAPGLARLAAGLASGAWHDRYADLLAREELDCGYRLVVADL